MGTEIYIVIGIVVVIIVSAFAVPAIGFSKTKKQKNNGRSELTDFIFGTALDEAEAEELLSKPARTDIIDYEYNKERKIITFYQHLERIPYSIKYSTENGVTVITFEEMANKAKHNSVYLYIDELMEKKISAKRMK